MSRAMRELHESTFHPPRFFAQDTPATWPGAAVSSAANLSGSPAGTTSVQAPAGLRP